MRYLILLSLVAAPAFADIISSEEAECRGKAAGAACRTSLVGEGTCVETTVSRPDYSRGVPPTYRPEKVLTCVQNARGSARSALPWVGVGLSFLALMLGVLFRPRSPGALAA